MASVSKGFDWLDVHEVSNLVGTGGDDTAFFMQALDRCDKGFGGKVVVPPHDQPYRVDGTIEIAALRHLYVSAGAVIQRPTPTDGSPLVRMAGNRSRLTGEGLIETFDASPNGAVKIGPPGKTHLSAVGVVNGTSTVTDPSAPFGTANTGDSFSVKCPGQPYFNTTISSIDSAGQITLTAPVPFSCSPALIFWLGGNLHSVVASHVRDVRIQGVEAPGNIGVLMQSAPQGSNFGTFGNMIRDTYVDGFDEGLVFDAQANANFGRDVYFRDIISNAVHGRHSDEWSFHGGFVQSSPGATMLRLTDVFASTTWQFHAEPGGGAASAAYHVDADSQDNVVGIMDNIGGGSTDLGVQTTTWGRARLSFGHNRLGFYDEPPTTQPATNGDIHNTGLAAAP